MANKAVLGAMALVGAGYTATEYFKDARVQKEREERERLQKDRQEAYRRRMEKSEKKKGKKFANRKNDGMGDNGGIPSEMLRQRYFQRMVYSRIGDILYDLILKVGEEGLAMRRESPINKLNLPLMSNENDKYDLMMAAAFALGDDDLIKQVTQLSSTQKLGIGLKKFSPKSVKQIIKVFQSVEDPEIDHHTLSLFIQMGVYDSRFQSVSEDGQLIPALFAPKDFRYSNSRRRMGNNFGFHVSYESCLEKVEQDWDLKDIIRRKKKMLFEFRGPSSEEWKRIKISEGMILSNFLCDFETPVSYNGTFIQPDMGRIQLIGSPRNHNKCVPDVDAMADAFADKVAFDMANVAATRLSKLLDLNSDDDQQKLLPLEHIAVNGGNESNVLSVLSQSDIAMISEQREKISATLQETLKNSVKNVDELQTSNLEADISKFVDSYLRLLTLSYCEIPRVGGNPPSSFVPNFSVEGEALKDSVWIPNRIMVHSTHRLLEMEERERVKRSRMLVAPGFLSTIAFIASVLAVSSWISLLATDQGLQWIYPKRGTVFLVVMSQALCFWALHSIVEYLKVFLELTSDTSWWGVSSCCTEYIQRIRALKLGKPTPYDQEIKRLKDTCNTQYRKWKLKIAKRGFYAALEKKCISVRECVFLLTEFADSYVEDGETEVIEGVIPATLDEAEEFLKLKVEEKVPCTEISLSSDEALKNYISKDSEEGSCSAIEEINNMSAKVKKCVEFSEGDRVIVRFDDELFSQVQSEDEMTQLACIGSRTGSVSFCTATLCFVHFDGIPVVDPTPVPISSCSILDEHSTRESLHSIPSLEESMVVDSIKDENDEELSSSTDESDGIRAAPQASLRARTIEEALVQGGWKLKRTKKHIKYS